MSKMHNLQEKTQWLTANFGNLVVILTKEHGFVTQNPHLETANEKARATIQASGPSIGESISRYFDKVTHPRLSHLVFRQDGTDHYMTVNPNTLEIRPWAPPRHAV